MGRKGPLNIMSLSAPEAECAGPLEHVYSWQYNVMYTVDACQGVRFSPTRIDFISEYYHTQLHFGICTPENCASIWKRRLNWTEGHKENSWCPRKVWFVSHLIILQILVLPANCSMRSIANPTTKTDPCAADAIVFIRPLFLFILRTLLILCLS